MAFGIGAIPQLSPGDYPGKDPFILGPITFNSIECPGDLPIGAIEQKVVSLEFIGGGKETQSLGGQLKPVQWTGTFYQPNVDSRITALQKMANDGKEYPITWRTQRYFCKVKDFTPGFQNANLCTYDITVEITRPANGALPANVPTSVDQQIGTTIYNAQSQNAAVIAADPAGSSTFQQAITDMQAAIQAAMPIAAAAGPQAASVLASINAAISAVQVYANGLKETQSQFIPAQLLLTSLRILAQNVQRGQSQNTTRIQGVSMYELASMKYNDVSLGLQLAQANGLAAPFTSAILPTQVSFPLLPTR